MADITAKGKLVTLASIALLSVVCAGRPDGGATKPMQDREKCKYWQAKVDPSITLSKGATEVSNANENNALEGIECLMKLEGRTSPSNFSSATVGYDLSQRFPSPTIEVAALYYASYLFHQKWQHAKAIILMDKRGKKNTKKSIQTAYKAYRSWLETVRETGLEKARKQNLDPLDGTEIRWY